MSKDTKFKKGMSGNPRGRPRTREATETAFDIIFDKRVPSTRNGENSELTVEEALEHQTLQNAIAGKRSDIRTVLKWIAKRHAILSRNRDKVFPISRIVLHNGPDNASEALRLLGIAEPDMRVGGCRWNIHTWAAQAALSRPGRKKFTKAQKKNIEFFTFDPHKLRWPKGRIHDE